MSDLPQGPAMITGTLSLEDFRAAQRLHLKTRRRNVLIALLVMGILGGVSLALGYLLVGAFLLPGAAAGFASHFAEQVILARRLKRTFEQQSALRLPLSYWWDEQSISARNDMGQSKRPWSSYVRIREGEHAFLLYQTDQLFEMVPKAWFASGEQMDQFRSFANPKP